jgi:hypothetical protein
MSSVKNYKSLQSLSGWSGSFPGEHEFSVLDDLEQRSDNPDLEIFQSVAEKVVEQWQGSHFAGMYLYGPTGTGKTHAAIGLGRALCEADAEVHYIYAPTMGTVSNLWTGQRFHSPKQDAQPVFPYKYAPGQKRNPKTVLILDEYRPEHRSSAIEGIDAAAQFGGFVIITSNYDDPFKLVESAPPATSAGEVAVERIAQDLNPDEYATNQAVKKAAEAEISNSFRSRIDAGFTFIQFAGADLRLVNNFFD